LENIELQSGADFLPLGNESNSPFNPDVVLEPDVSQRRLGEFGKRNNSRQLIKIPENKKAVLLPMYSMNTTQRLLNLKALDCAELAIYSLDSIALLR
jgi:hypothetical protein